MPTVLPTAPWRPAPFLLTPTPAHPPYTLHVHPKFEQVYDVIVNPGHWTEDMRADALQPAQLDSPDLKVGRGGAGDDAWVSLAAATTTMC